LRSAYARARSPQTAAYAGSMCTASAKEGTASAYCPLRKNAVMDQLR